MAILKNLTLEKQLVKLIRMQDIIRAAVTLKEQ